MILYLTSTNKVNLLDFIEEELELPVKKLIGSFSLNAFVVKDMRFYSHVHYLAIDREAIKETDEEMVQALLSFQMMYEMRIIMINEGLPESSPFLLELIKADIQNVVTAETIEMIQDELRECFSEVGMLRRNPAKESVSIEVVPPSSKVEEVTQFQFKCTNVVIAIAGCDRRVGVTTTAFNLVCWINAHGGTACYFESNTSNHLAHIIQLFKPDKNGNAYSIEGSDFYMMKELNQDYNFYVVDCGVIGASEPHVDFINANLRVLCGSTLPYEIPIVYRAMEICKGLEFLALVLFAPIYMRSYIKRIFNEDVFLAKHRMTCLIHQ